MRLSPYQSQEPCRGGEEAVWFLFSEGWCEAAHGLCCWSGDLLQWCGEAPRVPTTPALTKSPVSDVLIPGPSVPAMPGQGVPASPARPPRDAGFRCSEKEVGFRSSLRLSVHLHGFRFIFALIPSHCSFPAAGPPTGVDLASVINSLTSFPTV